MSKKIYFWVLLGLLSLNFEGAVANPADNNIRRAAQGNYTPDEIAMLVSSKRFTLDEIRSNTMAVKARLAQLMSSSSSDTSNQATETAQEPTPSVPPRPASRPHAAPASLQPTPPATEAQKPAMVGSVSAPHPNSKTGVAAQRKPVPPRPSMPPAASSQPTPPATKASQGPATRPLPVPPPPSRRPVSTGIDWNVETSGKLTEAQREALKKRTSPPPPPRQPQAAQRVQGFKIESKESIIPSMLPQDSVMKELQIRDAEQQKRELHTPAILSRSSSIDSFDLPPSALSSGKSVQKEGQEPVLAPRRGSATFTIPPPPFSLPPDQDIQASSEDEEEDAAGHQVIRLEGLQSPAAAGGEASQQSDSQKKKPLLVRAGRKILKWAGLKKASSPSPEDSGLTEASPLAEKVQYLGQLIPPRRSDESLTPEFTEWSRLNRILTDSTTSEGAKKDQYIKVIRLLLINPKLPDFMRTEYENSLPTNVTKNSSYRDRIDYLMGVASKVLVKSYQGSSYSQANNLRQAMFKAEEALKTTSISIQGPAYRALVQAMKELQIQMPDFAE
ncbi:MAG: hypothetical protein WCG05_01060 [Alphaproteobacteria bacterium]